MTRKGQQGLSLLEVLVAQVLIAVGLIGAAGLQMRSLQGTDSARMASQAAWIAHGMLERARSTRGVDGADQLEFQRQIEAFAGAAGRGELRQGGRQVTVGWSDERAGGGSRLIELGVPW
ncbi:type IV pilus modification protein PilV [Pseudomonas sp. zfem002]|uniref:type IV pilus modification protein PilV n=1 Tax=Pseudomonas sp. zfem002 TaxID=3078197 RepID=UPI002928FEC4|nr:type IV pilus modification protein PilV [Pseudomonas sp. zfem002]MDU9390458.1 type IV pilus modification protein PilV [Pseudomonas sp. zfem002]